MTSILSPEIIENQATINVGTIGHVAHGKSTLVRAISGVNTIKFKKELERNITIKLGYANAKIYKCNICPRPKCYKSFPSSQKGNQLPCPNLVKQTNQTKNQQTINQQTNHQQTNNKCTGTLTLQRHVSFVDSPGHETLMSTMMSGVATMDAAILLVAGNEECPQPQTKEHLAAIETMNMKNMIIVQNKVDLVPIEQAIEQKEQIQNFVKCTVAEGKPIIPISAQMGYNIDVICEYLCNLPVPQRDLTSSPQMNILRSFDINKPGSDFLDLKGGVIGGSLIKGILRVGDLIEIRPGLLIKEDQTKNNPNNNNQNSKNLTQIRAKPIQTVITSLFSESNQLEFAVPGGLIGIGTTIDPTLCRSDRLVGQILGKPEDLPPILTKIEINFWLMRRILGLQDDDTIKKQPVNHSTTNHPTTNQQTKQKPNKVDKLRIGEVLLINIGSNTTQAKVIDVLNDSAKLSLYPPICANPSDKLALSRKINQRWRLIGWGKLVRGK